MLKPLYEAPSLDDVLPELVFAQNLPSIVCGQVLDPQPGDCVIDLCASPGNILVQSLPVFLSVCMLLLPTVDQMIDYAGQSWIKVMLLFFFYLFMKKHRTLF